MTLDAYWDTQSVVVNDMNDTLLMNNPTLINGAQIPNIPLHTYGASVDLTNTHGGEVYLTYTHFDDYNIFNRPAFGTVDGFFNQRLSDTMSINLGVSNIFDSDADNYGRIGLGLFQVENQFGTDLNAVQQGTERFGLGPRSFTFMVTQRVGGSPGATNQ